MPKKPVSEPRIRTQYTREFKEEAVRQAVARDRPVNSVARELGLRPSVLRDWMRTLAGPAGPPRDDKSGRGTPPSPEACAGARDPGKGDGLLR
jgi:transposase-like protein